jgi:hypothetical protein
MMVFFLENDAAYIIGLAKAERTMVANFEK